MKVSRQLDRLHVRTQGLSQAGRALGNNEQVLIKKRQRQDISGSFTGMLSELAYLGGWHAKILSLDCTSAKTRFGILWDTLSLSRRITRILQRTAAGPANAFSLRLEGGSFAAAVQGASRSNNALLSRPILLMLKAGQNLTTSPINAAGALAVKMRRQTKAAKPAAAYPCRTEANREALGT
jgi:hypothetical protein